MCLPNSELVFRLLDRLHNRKDCEERLHRLGLCMHVLADTWAHQYFAGLPAWHINDACGDVVEGENNQKKTLTFRYHRLKNNNDDLAKYYFGCTPIMSRYNSVAYLGHGRMGHLPDYAFMTYKYAPLWKQGKNSVEKTLTKNNHKDHFNAFAQMVHVMACFKSGYQVDADEFQNKSVNLVDPDITEKIHTVLSQRVLSQNAEWKTLIQERFPGDVVPDFDKKEWLQDGNKSHYDFFMVAAKEHLEMVRSFVSEKGINLDSENLM